MVERVLRPFKSSIGKKMLMAFTGLFWVAFLIPHLAGNLLLICGEEAFMAYANAITANKPLMYTAEAIMIVMLVTHMSLALNLSAENREARKSRYAYPGPPVEASMPSRMMLQTGLVIFVFLILHLWTFKFGIAADENLYQNVMRRFSNCWYTLTYVVCMVAVGCHVTHGFQSAFQTLGVNHEKYTPLIKKASCGLGAFLAIGFSSIAIYCLMKGGQS